MWIFWRTPFQDWVGDEVFLHQWLDDAMWGKNLASWKRIFTPKKIKIFATWAHARWRPLYAQLQRSTFVAAFVDRSHHPVLPVKDFAGEYYSYTCTPYASTVDWTTGSKLLRFFEAGWRIQPSRQAKHCSVGFVDSKLKGKKQSWQSEVECHCGIMSFNASKLSYLLLTKQYSTCVQENGFRRSVHISAVGKWFQEKSHLKVLKKW